MYGSHPLPSTASMPNAHEIVALQLGIKPNSFDTRLFIFMDSNLLSWSFTAKEVVKQSKLHKKCLCYNSVVLVTILRRDRKHKSCPSESLCRPSLVVAFQCK